MTFTGLALAGFDVLNVAAVWSLIPQNKDEGVLRAAVDLYEHMRTTVSDK